MAPVLYMRVCCMMKYGLAERLSSESAPHIKTLSMAEMASHRNVCARDENEPQAVNVCIHNLN